jgi:hypothetical protein
MSEFITNLSSIYWWLSIVIVGILINLFSAYLKIKLDTRLSTVSSWWRKRSEARKTRRLAELDRLRGNPNEQIMLALSEVRKLVKGVLAVGLGSVCYLLVIGVQSSPNFSLERISSLTKFFMILLLFLGTIGAFIGMLLFRGAENSHALLNESRSSNEHEDDKNAT